MSELNYVPLPACGDYYENEHGEMGLLDDSDAWYQQELTQQTEQEYDRQQLITCLERVMQNDGNDYLKLKAEEFLCDIKLIIEMELH